MCGSRSHGTGSGFHFGSFTWVWFTAWSRHSSNSLEDVKRTYVQSLFILVLPHVETLIAKRKRNKISKERKTEYCVLAKAKSKYAGKAVFSDETRVGEEIVNTKKTGLGVLVGYRRGYVGHSAKRRAEFEPWKIWVRVSWGWGGGVGYKTSERQREQSNATPNQYLVCFFFLINGRKYVSKKYNRRKLLFSVAWSVCVCVGGGGAAVFKGRGGRQLYKTIRLKENYDTTSENPKCIWLQKKIPIHDITDSSEIFSTYILRHGIQPVLFAHKLNSYLNNIVN